MVQSPELDDVVVVGSGSGGGVVAARLSEDDRCCVLLREAGPDFPQEPPLQPLLPTFVIGEVAADLIRGAGRLDPD